MSEPPRPQDPPGGAVDDGIPVLTEVVHLEGNAPPDPQSDRGRARERVLVARLLHALRPWLRDRPNATLVAELQGIVRDALGRPTDRPPGTGG
jgi:hypothetical protein